MRFQILMLMMMTYKTPCYADYIIVDNFSITHQRLQSMSVRVLHNRGVNFYIFACFQLLILLYFNTGDKPMKLLCTTVFTLSITTASFADIYQYEDCDGDGSLFLTDIDPEPYATLDNLYLGCANLYNEDLTSAYMQQSDLSGAILTNSSLDNVFFLSSDLTNANLDGCSLTNAYMNGAAMIDASMINADMTNATVMGVDFTNGDMVRVILVDASCNQAIFINAFMPEADFSYASASYADFTNAQLMEVNVYNAHFLYSSFNGANLSGVINWENADWRFATWTKGTTFPSGMDPSTEGMIYDDGCYSTEGACCVSTGCALMEEPMCSDLGGNWLGECGNCDDCTTPPDSCAADLDGDGEVDVADLLLLIAAWGACP